MKFFSQKQLKDYATLLSSKTIFIKGCGHFGLRSGVKDIREIEKVLADIIENSN